MLPLPLVRITRRRLRDWLKRVDSYTLWAFNLQPPLAPAGSGRKASAPTLAHHRHHETTTAHMSLSVAPFEPFHELHEKYVALVNIAISEGREDRAWDLAKQFDEEVLLLAAPIQQG